MATKQQIDDFFTLPSFALVGASQDKNRLSNIVFKMFKEKGMKVYPVNPKYDEIDGEKCYPNLKSVPETVFGAVLITSRTNTEKLIGDVIDAGIDSVWLQQGSASKETIEKAKNGIGNVISKKCILMFAEPVTGGHKFHRSLKKLFGGLYK